MTCAGASDVDDLDEAGGIGALERIVGMCNMLLVVMTDGYFHSKNCALTWPVLPQRHL